MYNPAGTSDQPWSTTDAIWYTCGASDDISLGLFLITTIVPGGDSGVQL